MFHLKYIIICAICMLYITSAVVMLNVINVGYCCDFDFVSAAESRVEML